MEFGPGGVVGIVGLLWFLCIGPVFACWFLLVIAIWKGMRAHQSIAKSLIDIATFLKSDSEQNSI